MLLLDLCSILSPDMYLETNLCTFGRYIKEGSSISVFGILQRSNDVMVVTPPQELISTGYLWKKLLLPVDVDGLILAIP